MHLSDKKKRYRKENEVADADPFRFLTTEHFECARSAAHAVCARSSPAFNRNMAKFAPSSTAAGFDFSSSLLLLINRQNADCLPLLFTHRWRPDQSVKVAEKVRVPIETKNLSSFFQGQMTNHEFRSNLT